MKKGFFVFVLATAFTAPSLIAQDGPPPVTKQDLERSEQRIKQTIRKAASGAAKVNNANRSAEKQEHQGIVGAITSAEQETQNAIVQANAATTRKIDRLFSVIAISVGLLALIFGALVWRVRKGRNTITVVERSQPPEDRIAIPEPVVTTVLPVNPRPRQIRDYIAANPAVVSFEIVFSDAGITIQGTVARKHDDIWTVDFPGSGKTPCGIDKAYKTALQIISEMQAARQEMVRQ